ncbi:MAG: NgoFVII family restriction endonuclease [Chloroflexi bacterium]|nr:NgoFVII family restriction endonuclease [Chloroflexota bacterium]MYD47681.1 NgoFVII family restriction endonuclease [Chloroflexota bacterium]
MPRIFDNLTPDSSLLPALQDTLGISDRADFCVGYFNLRGWGGLAPFVNGWQPEDGPCRVLIGMQRLPHDDLRQSVSLVDGPAGMDNQTAHRLRVQMAEQLRQQLTMGAPTNADERTLGQLADQLRAKKVVVKLFLRHPLHAKLYLLYRDDPVNPIVGYLGSSNLTFAGLAGQGELNVDVLDHDATLKLKAWFEARWSDRFCVDVSDELLQIIEESWARETLIPPYHVYLKMAYHLSREARAGLAEFRIPKAFGDRLFDFQAAAVKIAAHHLNRRNGVLIGDVVGLGKTLMATALARIFEDDYGLETLIICPKNLVPMWEDYAYQYQLRAKVISLSTVIGELPTLRRYRLVVIDESHNLRNREGRRYRAIQEYVRANESKCILLSATPYNKTYLDLSSQLGIFVEEDRDLGIRPERLLRELGEVEFGRRHQASPRTLAAFDFSPYADDWRDLMRLFLVRRTRSFIQNNYAETDGETGRKYLTYGDGARSYFPNRVPKTVGFAIDDADPNDQYAKLYSAQVVDLVNDLSLPRYGLGNYVVKNQAKPPTGNEKRQVDDLSRAGKRLMGFCRTNLFKRLESSGMAFLQSVERHVLRNYVFLYAIKNGLPLPIGTQDAEMLDSRFTDEDADRAKGSLFDPDDDEQEENVEDTDRAWTASDFEAQAERIYAEYRGRFHSRFRWLRVDLFKSSLRADLQSDSDALLRLLRGYGRWDPNRDAKLDALERLLRERYPDRKVLVFSQFADTVHYLEAQLKARGIEAMAGVTGSSADPTELARRFSPESNRRAGRDEPDQELRVLVATDVLSEGQNLQDCHVVVNYDLPWAIIRLIQRAGRVDRIGQKAEEILCHSFLPADGVERIIDLRGRVRNRLRQNAEVVGADETFFEDEDDEQAVVNLYHERAGVLDGDPDGEVDLASHAYQIWKNAVGADPRLEKTVAELPDVVFSSRRYFPIAQRPEGVLVFLRTADGNDALAYVDREGRSITESQLEILSAAECEPGAPAQPRHESHHDLVAHGVRRLTREEKRAGGQLGRPSGARFRTYTRLRDYEDAIKGQLFDVEALHRAIDDIYRYPLRPSAVDTLNRQLRSGADDGQLADIVMTLREEDRLCLTTGEEEAREPQILCSLGLFQGDDEV